jgi:hypothetical protein
VKPVQKDSYLPLYWTLDFNVNPMSSAVVQIRGEEIYVIDEIVLNRASTQEACAEFARRHLPHPGGVVVHGDASANRMQTTGLSDAETVKHFFQTEWRQRVEYRIPKANPMVRLRVDLVNGKLQSADGVRRLFVGERCGELIADFEQVQWKGNTNEIDKDQDPRRTHMSDALGYLIWDRFSVKQRAGERDQRLAY